MAVEAAGGQAVVLHLDAEHLLSRVRAKLNHILQKQGESSSSSSSAGRTPVNCSGCVPLVNSNMTYAAVTGHQSAARK